MIVVLLLVVVMGIAGALLQSLVREQRQLRSVGRQHQAAWLAEAGVERAVARLRAAPAYTGETWDVPAATLDGDRGGRVEIRVQPLAGQPRRRIQVTADFPNDPVYRHRCRVDLEVAIASGPAEVEGTEP